MKTKSKEKKVVECAGAFNVERVAKSGDGWNVDAVQENIAGASPKIVLFKFGGGVCVSVGISKPDFDLIQPGDQIKFFAVVTKPRKKRVKKDIVAVPERSIQTINDEIMQAAGIVGNVEKYTNSNPKKATFVDGMIQTGHSTPAIKEGAAWK